MAHRVPHMGTADQGSTFYKNIQTLIRQFLWMGLYSENFLKTFLILFEGERKRCFKVEHMDVSKFASKLW